MSRVGINRHTGEILRDWDHVAQSISDIVTTMSQTRVFRRAYGGDVSDFIDAPMNAPTMMQFFVSIANALEGWVHDGLGNLVHKPTYGEPGFQLKNILINSAGADGGISIVLVGDYYPNGHLDDFETVIPVDGLRVVL